MSYFNQQMVAWGSSRSAIREIFEYGNRRAEEIGRENIFDFSLGNPSVPAPQALGEEIARLAAYEDPVLLHGYTSAQGAPGTRQAIADELNRRFGTAVGKDDLYLTCGAAASVAIVLKALVEPGQGDEVLVIAPFFPEYRVFAEAAGATLTVVPADEDHFGIRISDLEARISSRTKAVIINVPNNPTGVIYPEKTVRELCLVLERKSAEYGHPVYLISDEPYRELVYDKAKGLPFITHLYKNAVVCYSFSKSLSVPGERFGYILIPSEADDSRLLYAAVCGAGRALGYVCAPSLMQNAIPRVLNERPDLTVYRKNRDLLLNALTSYGFRCIPPDGAFYLFMQSPEPDAGSFCKKARDFEILMVPSDSFGVTGFVRIAYCVKTEMVEKSLSAFRKLAEAYGLGV